MREKQQSNTGAMRRAGGLVVALLGTAGILALTLLIGQQTSGDLWRYALYQAAALAVAILVVLAVTAITRAPLPRWGSLRAPARRMAVLGVAEGESWRRVGITFAAIISVVTAVFLVVGYGERVMHVGWASWGLAFVVALPLSVTNALSEELITRWAVVASFSGSWSRVAPWASALLFGGVHWFGIPGGPVGALMAGFLGWLLARAIQDTRGIGWAWIVHFCQDVLIFTVTIALVV